MTVRILSPAQSDVAAAIAYYEEQQPGLGVQFADELVRMLGRIGQFPSAWPFFSKRSRRCPMRRFPYGIAYQVRAEEVVVSAVMHLHREPRAWLNRLRAGEE